ncbi:bacteriophage antitermination protein Q [Escherichia coli]|uniref:bacteriophage antitermination protein Q n=1 Tax=Escherichia coli TaxID=562 RepID=UPI0012DE15A0|nr:bacteriophage antitermination protein Q [Escherichia coli]EFI6254295.1 antiterminator [Escherichia coli]EFO2973540.1 antiterminator [Escherichia coli]EFT2689322.1 antiterminator [Escherichia coli]EGI4341792.1 antiterminator [Escherichia coli]EHE8161008.1 antiterminator [Escherichia coli]
MNNQYLQFVREQLMIATTDLSGATKGQLEAWQENAMFDTGRYRRKKIRYRDEVTGKMITRNNPPIPGKQSLAKGTSIPLVSQVEFSTSSWRRAVLSLEEHHKAWLLWCYSGSICWEHQIAITQWAWNEFNVRSGTRKIAEKTRERLKKLIWLAAQDVRGWVTGHENYQRQELARLCGIKPDNWGHNYANYWREMCYIFKDLDTESLICTVKMRAQQKATFSRRDVAKIN